MSGYVYDKIGLDWDVRIKWEMDIHLRDMGEMIWYISTKAAC